MMILKILVLLMVLVGVTQANRPCWSSERRRRRSFYCWPMTHTWSFSPSQHLHLPFLSCPAALFMIHEMKPLHFRASPASWVLFFHLLLLVFLLQHFYLLLFLPMLLHLYLLFLFPCCSLYTTFSSFFYFSSSLSYSSPPPPLKK